MIAKIRQALIAKFTLTIACILLIGFAASYTAYQRTGIHLLKDTLRDYLTEELWEAQEFIRNNRRDTEVHKINSDIKSLHNFTYWLLNKQLIHAEQPRNDMIAAKLQQRILSRNYKSQKIYHENIKYNKQKWYFLVSKQTLVLTPKQTLEVFVIANYTPMRKNTRTYVKIALSASLLMILLAYLIGSFFASRSMRYIEQSYQKQRRFVSDAAHEFRTPLAILYAYAELLEHKPNNLQTITKIKNEVQQMNDMVDKLLILARYENTVSPLQKKPVSLNSLLTETVQAFSATTPPQTFSLNCPPEDICTMADPVLLRQMLYILLDNAVKYTRDDKKITLSLKRQKNQAVIAIVDNGIGLKPQDLPHIFDRFWRAEKSRSSQGLGLGLSLAQLIIEKHGGKISVKSQENLGTTFTITLPLT